MVKAYQMLDMLLPGADLDALERAEAQVFDRYWGMSMSELRNIDSGEVREFAHQFRDLLLDLPFQVPQDLIYSCAPSRSCPACAPGWIPDVNLWEQAGPYARNMVAEEGGSDCGYAAGPGGRVREGHGRGARSDAARSLQPGARRGPT